MTYFMAFISPPYGAHLRPTGLSTRRGWASGLTGSLRLSYQIATDFHGPACECAGHPWRL